MYKGFQIIKRYSFVFPCPHYYLLFIFKRVKIKSKSQELLSLNFDCLISTCVSIFVHIMMYILNATQQTN